MARLPLARFGLGLGGRLTRFTALALLVGCATSPRVEPRPIAPPMVPPPFAYETFDAVWTTIDEKHFDPTHNGVDWIAVRDELRPKVADVRTNDELRALLNEMIGRLGQSHFGIIPKEIASPSGARAAVSAAHVTEPTHSPAAAMPIASRTPVESSTALSTHELAAPIDGKSSDAAMAGDPGVWFRLVDGSIVTVAPRPGGPAERAGIRAGWALAEVNGVAVVAPTRPAPATGDTAASDSTMVRYLAQNIAAHPAHFAPDRAVTLTFDTPQGRRTVEMVAGRFAGESVKFGNLPPLDTVVVERVITPSERDLAEISGEAGTFGSIAFNIWMIPAAPLLDTAVDRRRTDEGIVLDLRGNPGGVGAMAMGIGGHFLSEPLSLGRMVSPQGTIEFRVNPRRVTSDGRVVMPYSGPLAILVDPLTASTSEIFAAGMQELGRARVFGQTSAGAALPSIAVALPNDDVLQYAMADFITPAGNRIEGHGVVPDSPVELTRDSLSRDPDPVLTAALRWLADEALRRKVTAPAPTS